MKEWRQWSIRGLFRTHARLESGCVLHKRRERRSKSAVSSTCHRDDRHSAPSAERPAPCTGPSNPFPPYYYTNQHRFCRVAPARNSTVNSHSTELKNFLPRSLHVRDHPALSKPKIVRLSREISPTPSTFVVPCSFQSDSFRTRTGRFVACRFERQFIVDGSRIAILYIYIYI